MRMSTRLGRPATSGGRLAHEIPRLPSAGLIQGYKERLRELDNISRASSALSWWFRVTPRVT